MTDFDKLMEMKAEEKVEIDPIAVIGEDNPHQAFLLNHGSLELLQHMGDELNIVNAARQSFGQSSEVMNKADRGLINFLMRERHGTPFEMMQFLFQVKCPIFVAREWFRHRIGSFNEYSGRYTKMKPEFYVPALKDMRTQTGKPGTYEFKPMRDPTKAFQLATVIEDMGRECWIKYEALLKKGVAKEVARMVLPVSLYTQFTWSVNLRSLLNFISLRSDKTAMYEIRCYSRTIEQLIQPIIPETMKCFEANGRVAP